MKTTLQTLLATAIAVSAAIVIGCSNETETTASQANEAVPATREIASAPKTEVSLKVSGMT